MSRRRETPLLPTVKDEMGAATATRAGSSSGRGLGWWVAARV